MSKFVEIKFKGQRLESFGNPQEYPLKTNDYVMVSANNGEDIGKIHRLHEKISGCGIGVIKFDVLRKASQEELNKHNDNKKLEDEAKPVAKKLIQKHALSMKLTEVEYQLDRKKMTFYFTSEERVDFRELVKDLAKQYKSRIELRQINAREAARKIGGCGRCGLELCCTTCILHEFKPVSTQHAKDQLLSTNPSKLTGMCGRLRCCLRYELEMYKTALTEFPKLDSTISTPVGDAQVAKIDIFNKTVLLRYKDKTLEPLPLEDVQLLMAN